MFKINRKLLSKMLISCTIFFSGYSIADDGNYQSTINRFQKAPETEAFFEGAYGYAVFPTVGKGGIGIGGAYGEGRVYKQGTYVGNTSLSQLTIGFQLGAQAYSEMIFFENENAFNAFSSGTFSFGAQASAVALTVGANAQAGTSGISASAGDQNSIGEYVNGMAVFTLAKGGLMYEATIGGQGFTYSEK